MIFKKEIHKSANAINSPQQACPAARQAAVDALTSLQTDYPTETDAI